MAKGKHDAPGKSGAKKKASEKDTPTAKRKKTEKSTPAKRVGPKKTTAARSAESGKKDRRGEKGRNAVYAAVLIVIIIFAAITVAGMLIGKSGKIAPNITVNGTDLGGMTLADAELALDKSGFAPEGAGEVAVKLPFDYIFTVTSKDAGLELTSRDAAERALAYGHSGSIFRDLAAYLRCAAGKVTEEDVLGSSDAGNIKAAVEKALADYNTLHTKTCEADITAGKLMVIKGADSLRIDADELCAMIDDAFRSGKPGVEYRLPAQDGTAPDFKALHDELFTEVKEAVYDKDAGKMIPGSAGVDFDIDEAQRLYDEATAGDTVVIPLTITKPRVSEEDPDGGLFADKLGAQTTLYKSSTEGRATNVELSAAKVNGVILNPGEVFSFNDVVGKRTAEAGYRTATAYAGGKVIEEIGGGICQTSSTLYCAALFANLEIVTRTEHQFSVSYVPYGMDATVSWGGPEFRFRNNRDYPIKIVARTADRELTVEIWGTDVDGSYVEMTNSVSTRYDKKYPTVAIGTDAVTYRSVFDKDKNLISRELEARSYYCYHQEDIRWPASPSPSQEVTPTATPEPTPTVEPSVEPTVEPTPEPTEEVTPTEPVDPAEEEPLPDDPD